MCDPRGSSQGHEFTRWWLSFHSSYPGAYLQIRWKAAHCPPACRSPRAPDSSAGWGAGGQQGLRGKPGRKIRGEQGGGSAEWEHAEEKTEVKRTKRAEESKPLRWPQNPLHKRSHSVCSFLGKPTCGGLNHHTHRHARVCRGGYKHRRRHQLVWARLKVCFTLYVIFIYFITVTGVSIVMKLTS